MKNIKLFFLDTCIVDSCGMGFMHYCSVREYKHAVSPWLNCNKVMRNLAHWSAAWAGCWPACLSLAGQRPANCDGAYCSARGVKVSTLKVEMFCLSKVHNFTSKIMVMLMTSSATL